MGGLGATVIGCAVAGALGACAGGHAAARSSSAAPTPPPVRVVGRTYQVPDPLPVGRPGDLVGASDEGPDPVVGGARRWTVLYHSSDVGGRDIAVSGAVLVPPGTPPSGGWPVVSWGHGTTGIADRCAPSETANLFYNEYAQEARSFLEAGYAVVATDYPGLGTPTVHSYLIGVDEGNAMVDVVTAAHHLVPGLAPDWFAVGHSQGGQAVLFATRAASRAPDLRLRASVAIAPASGLHLILPAVLSGSDPSDVSYGVYSLVGLSAVDPTVRLTDVLGPAGQAQLALVLDGACLDQTDAALRQAAPSAVFHLSPDRVAQLGAELGRYDDPDNQATVGPVLVVQGSADQDVPAPLTRNLVANLRRQGSDVTEREYTGLNHDGVLGPSSCDVLSWLGGKGGRPLGACTPHPTDLS